MNNQGIMERIETAFDTLSKGQKRIAGYILEHYDKAAFLNATKLGKMCDVSESTVVRFATQLGYEGYPQLQRDLQESIRTKLTTSQRIGIIDDKIGQNGDTLSVVLNSDIDKIRKTLDRIDRQMFDSIVNAILNAKHIYILGVRSSAALASFLGFYMNLMFDNVKLVQTTSVSEMFEQILRIDEGDVVIGISFPRYSRRTIEALHYAKQKKCTVIGITDSEKSPVHLTSDYSIIAKSDMVSFADSLVAPLSVINALIVALSMKKKEEVYSTFDELENIWHEYGVYEPYDGVTGDTKNTEKNKND